MKNKLNFYFCVKLKIIRIIILLSRNIFINKNEFYLKQGTNLFES